MTDTHTPSDPTAAAIEAEFEGRWGIWLSSTGRWWAAFRGPLSATDQAAGCVPFLRADTSGQLSRDIQEQEHLRLGEEPSLATGTSPAPALSTGRGAPQGAVALLELLAGELTRRGWSSRIHNPPGSTPNLAVTNPAVSALNDRVIAAPAHDGTWCYWWSWAQLIGPVSEPVRAAQAITRVLRSADES